MVKKRFNTVGICISKKHYMVDISNKLDEIENLIDNEFYFVINRPRQYGKTTTLNELYNRLKNKYTVIDISFEGIDEKLFKDSKLFCNEFINLMKDSIEDNALLNEFKEVDNISELSELISNITADREIILLIDEVDKSANNKLFLNFLSMLRDKYIKREKGRSTSFKSVILAGVYDIKNLKLKLRDDEERMYNSPWNIAVNFDIDMSFNENEIASMLEEYSKLNNLSMNIIELSKEIYKFTSGYPFLVSRICQIVDENILKNDKKEWHINDIHMAVKILLFEHNTLFDDLIKNLENNNSLYELIETLLVFDVEKKFEMYNPEINLGYMFGYLKNENGYVKISNIIFSELVYNYMTSKIDNKNMSNYNFKDNFITVDGGLDIRKVLLKFQQFMKENYSEKDIEFLETHGRLLFLAFIKPIINGVGFEFKEVQISEEKRLDVVITYNNHKYIIEMKKWYGEKAHQKGINQLVDYLNIEGLNEGYLLIFNFNKNKEYHNKEFLLGDKAIFEIMV